MTLLIDPMEDLFSSLCQIEDWLLWADPDSDHDAELVARGAHAAGVLAGALKVALDEAPRLMSPERVCLALIVSLPSETTVQALNALAGAVAALAYDPNQPAVTAPSLALLAGCVAQDGTDDTVVLCEVLNVGGSGGRWLGLEGDDEIGGDVGHGTRRWTTRLGLDEHRAYRRFVAAVLTDPLERFAASGQ